MPLSFDLPFESLASYGGRNPKPVDFDAYWKASLDELEKTGADVEFAAAKASPPAGKGGRSPFAEYYDLWFTGVGGARIHAKLVRPVGDAASRLAGGNGKGPAVLLFHGYTGDSGDWRSKLGMAAAGFTVAAMDCRGQGGLSEDKLTTAGNTQHGHIVRGLSDAIAGRPEKLLYRSIFLDTVRLARIVMGMEWIDPERVGATGASQGGALTIACAALEPRIARAAPIYPFLSDYKRVWEMDAAEGAYGELREWFRHFDPLHQNEDAVFNALGYIDIQHLAPRIRADLLMATGLMDRTCPPSTQFAAYNRVPGPKALAVYPDFAHEGLPGIDDRILGFMGGL